MSSKTAPSTATRVDLIVDGQATYAALVEAIAAAREHVHVEYYIFAPDRTSPSVKNVPSFTAQARMFGQSMPTP